MNVLFEWLAKFFDGVKLWVIVKPWEKCVRVRLGKHAKELHPGAHFRIPFADDVIIVNTRLRIASVPSVTLTLSDDKTITVAAIVGFRIVEPLQAMMTLEMPEYSCSALAMATISEYLSGKASTDITARDMEYAACAALVDRVRGVEFDFVNASDYAICRTYRLLQETARPSTMPDAPVAGSY